MDSNFQTSRLTHSSETPTRSELVLAIIPQHLSPHDRACEALASASRSLAYASDLFAAMGLPGAEEDARQIWMELLRLNSDVTKVQYRQKLRTRPAALRAVS